MTDTSDTAAPGGQFITFEGGEGTGKSTQIGHLASRLRAMGLPVTQTREPGGSAFAERIRALILDRSVAPQSPMAQALAFYAARADHLDVTIRPALASGAWVLCDRFADSTRAYQGAAGGTDPGLITALESYILEDIRPDLTLVFDLPADVGLARAHVRAGAEMRFESKGMAFHERLREGFLAIANAEPGRCVVIDAADDMDGVERAVWDAVTGRLAAHG